MCVFAEEMHAEICYAECLLQKATLTFVQVRTVFLFTSLLYYYIMFLLLLLYYIHYVTESFQPFRRINSKFYIMCHRSQPVRTRLRAVTLRLRHMGTTTSHMTSQHVK